MIEFIEVSAAGVLEHLVEAWAVCHPLPPSACISAATIADDD